MTYAIPLELPVGRGEAQPTLTVSYRSDRRRGEAGQGWRLNVSSIERAPISGWPRYADNGLPDDEDRYAYDGRPLTFVCVVRQTQWACPTRDAGLGPMPTWATGYRHYRLHVDDSFERFFLSADRSHWIVQRQGGVILEFGTPLTRTDLGGISIDRDANTQKPFRWNLVRAYDRHTKQNLTVYRWNGCCGRLLLSDIFFTPPATNPNSGLEGFAYHVQLSWEVPPNPQEPYAHIDRAEHRLRVRRVAVSSKTWEGVGPRQFVRAYNFSYFAPRTVPGNVGEAPAWQQPYLRSIQQEGRCAKPITEINESIPEQTGCPSLPPASFEYQPVTILQTVAIAKRVPLTENLPYPTNAAVLDVNRDGFPDIVQSWPQHPWSPNTWYNECPGPASRYFVVNSPVGPWLVCRHPDGEETYLRSAREHSAYVNLGATPGLPASTVSLQHHCLDAGKYNDSQYGLNQTPTRWQVDQAPLVGSPAALFSQFGAESSGPWADAMFLWSKAHWRGFAISAVAANDPERSEYCPQARQGHPSYDPSYRSLRWRQVNDDLWLQSAGSPVYGGVLTDVDGDGYPDRIGALSGGALGLSPGQVGFTRKISRLESTPVHQGPALIPFSSLNAERSLVASGRGSTYVDMNGDGLADFVDWALQGFADAGDPIPRVRPGNGRGRFECRPAGPTCQVTGNGSWMTPAYRIVVDGGTAPLPLTEVEQQFSRVLRQSFFQDVTDDGLADLVVFEPRQPGASKAYVRLWINTDGRSFRCANLAEDCAVAAIADADQPEAFDTAFRVVFTDFNADGTTDIVILSGSAVWYHSFLSVPPAGLGPRGSRPGLLTRVRNGTGADVEVEYRTIQELDRAARNTDSSSFTAPWTSHVPTVVPVVTRIRTRDTTSATGGSLPEPFPFDRAVAYSYRNPAYDAWDHAFKGFRRIRATTQSGEVIQTWFWFGPCQDGTMSAACGEGSDESPDNVWIGRPVRIDRLTDGPLAGPRPAMWLSTVTLTYSRRSFPSLTGDRPTSWATIGQRNQYLYDTAVPVSHTNENSIVSPGGLQPAPFQTQRVHLVTDLEYDAAGNLRKTVEKGKESGSPQDLEIISSVLPWDGRCGADWLCFPAGVRVEQREPGDVATSLLRHFVFKRSPFTGDLQRLDGELRYVSFGMAGHHLERSPMGTGEPAAAVTQPGLHTTQTIERDAYGNSKRVRSAPGSAQACTDTVFDPVYEQFPIAVHRHRRPGCGGNPLTSEFSFDRGLGQVTTIIERNVGSRTTIEFDGFGRLRALHKPSPDGQPLATQLALRVHHVVKNPLSYIKVDRRVDIDHFLTSYDIFNGLGEHVLGFDQADPAVDGAPGPLGAFWIARDWTERDGAGRIVLRRRPGPHYQDNALQVAEQGIGIPTSVPPTQAGYDAFGRLLRTYEGNLQTSSYEHKPLLTTITDAEQLKSTGPYAGLSASVALDGHGRVSLRTDPDGSKTRFRYLGSGEVVEIARLNASGTEIYLRTLIWDTFGRPVVNFEPNTSTTTGGVFKAWRYVYDGESRLVGTSDARGCGKNLHYDPLGRLIAEDYSPCDPGQGAYSSPDLASGSGAEAYFRYDSYEPGQVSPGGAFDDRDAFAEGRLTAIRDHGGHSRFNYDVRGRIRRESRQVARPGTTAGGASGYAPTWHSREFAYDLGDRIRQRSTGLRSAPLLESGESFETYAYSARGLLREIAGSYGPLITALRYDAGGATTHTEYTDAASTSADYQYDHRGRLTSASASRSMIPALWNSSTPVYQEPTWSTTQLDLVNVGISYDDASNITAIQDLNSSIWPSGAQPASRAFLYDGRYRLRTVDYAHGLHSHVPPFRPEAVAGDRRPIAERAGNSRILQQTFAYDAQGNVVASEDNEHLRYDRSLGAASYGRIVNGATVGPNQLTKADGIHADYDAAGNLRELTVSRSSCDTLMPRCSHRFRYDWDEVGQLRRARRWDFAAGAVLAFDGSATPEWELNYAYSAGGRIRTSFKDRTGVEVHTLDIFDTLRIQKATFDAPSTDYRFDASHEIGFLADGAARIFHDTAGRLQQPEASPRHIYYRIGDHLGSTSVVIDRGSGEVVERSTYHPYGSVESNYRPGRWNHAREDYKFTAKEEDIEVGLVYFGARYYVPRMGRWASADPLTIHGLGSDLNPYAYVGGHVLTHVDPLGLQCAAPFTRDGTTTTTTDCPEQPERHTVDRSAAAETSLESFRSNPSWTRFIGAAKAAIGTSSDVAAGARNEYLDSTRLGLIFFALHELSHGQFTTATLAWEAARRLEDAKVAENDTLAAGAGHGIVFLIGAAVGAGIEGIGARGAGRAAAATVPALEAVELPAALRGGKPEVHVYLGMRDFQRVYVGITNDLVRRQLQHGSRFVLEPVTRSPLTRGQARAIEQALIVRRQGLNIRNSISPRHPWYKQAVEWGEAWLHANGYPR